MDPNPLTSIHLSANQVEIIAFSLLLARCPILLSWKKAKPTSHKHWVVEVNLKVCYSEDPLESFIRSGSPFYLLLNPYGLLFHN